jgi:HK97 family phage prohead protease
MEFKSLEGSVIDISARRVKVAISEVDSKDLDNEIIAKDAYTKTISERGPGAANLIYHLGDHMPTTKSVIGKPSEIGMQGNKLYFVTDIVKTPYGNDMLEHYKSGIINQHSVGFSTIRAIQPKQEGDPRILTEVKLYEGSAVLWGANPNTPTLSVGKSIEELISESDLMLKEFTLIKKASKGPVTDETAELLEIRLEIYETRLKNIFAQIATQAEKSPAPVNEKLVQDIHLSLLKIF